MTFLTLTRGLLNKCMRLQSHGASKACFGISCVKYACTRNVPRYLFGTRLSSSLSGRNDDVDEDERQQQEMVNQMLPASITGHRVLVIQPYVKWGESKRRNTTPDLQANEAAALIGSLPKWTVEEKITVPLRSLHKKSLFGSGSLEMLRKKVSQSKCITAVFISIDSLQTNQHKDFESLFRVPVYDRFMIVIQIFRMHAITKEAKLQVAMAEIPFLWSRLKELPPGGTSDSNCNSEDRKKFLMQRETKMKRQLHKLRSQREMLRKNRSKFPIVAVVGYTNAGKTSLIKALTGDQRLQPRDELFATLDVTTHAGVLPCQLKVLYIDTVGFISDIPTTLIESFIATLEDAMLADVILHVRDVSHPDSNAQNDDVNTTLRQFQLSENLMENIIVAGNKVDLLQSERLETDDWIPVSALQQTDAIAIYLPEVDYCLQCFRQLQVDYLKASRS